MKEKVTCWQDRAGRGEGGAERESWEAVGAGEAVADLGWSAQLTDNLLILCAVDEQGVRLAWGLWPNLAGNEEGGT